MALIDHSMLKAERPLPLHSRLPLQADCERSPASASWLRTARSSGLATMFDAIRWSDLSVFALFTIHCEAFEPLLGAMPKRDVQGLDSCVCLGSLSTTPNHLDDGVLYIIRSMLVQHRDCTDKHRQRAPPRL